jgi:hypothetical protein
MSKCYTGIVRMSVHEQRTHISAREYLRVALSKSRPRQLLTVREKLVGT